LLTGHLQGEFKKKTGIIAVHN